MDCYSLAANYYKKSLNMFEDYFLVMENTQWEPFPFLPTKAKAW